MLTIADTPETYVSLWRELERARALCLAQGRRFCLRHLLRLWRELGVLDWQATGRTFDDLVWEVCRHCELEGWAHLPPPSLYPRTHRELLRCLVAARLGVGIRHIDLQALDAAYTVAYPHATPLNVRKQRRLCQNADGP